MAFTTPYHTPSTTIKMNATRQILSRRVVSMGPRLTTPVRFASSSPIAAHSGKMTKHERGVMRGIFTAATLATATGVLYAAARSGSRQNARFAKKNASLDSSKWFLEGADSKLFK